MKKNILLILIIPFISGCTTLGNVLNPFQTAPEKEAYYGTPNANELTDTGNKDDSARKALESVGTYREAHAPEPYNPVLNPAVVRLMWIPDHLNKLGDLVPAHYYYVKVLSDRWALQDAFELEGQLKKPGEHGNVPYITKDESVGN